MKRSRFREKDLDLGCGYVQFVKPIRYPSRNIEYIIGLMNLELIEAWPRNTNLGVINI